MDPVEKAEISAACARLMVKYDMDALVRSFPSLERRGTRWKTGNCDWDNCRNFKKAMRGMSHGEKCAAKFCLSVYNHMEHKFDMQDAVGVWDAEHRAVLVQWLMDPWWM